MDLLSFMSSFKCCKNFPLKIHYSESYFLEVYAVVHYIDIILREMPFTSHTRVCCVFNVNILCELSLVNPLSLTC